MAVTNNDNDVLAGTSCTAPFQTHGIYGEGDVSAQMEQRRLVIRGDAAANAIRIDADPGGSFVVTGLGGTRVNGQLGPLRFLRVRGLDVGMGGGDDRVFFGPAAITAIDATSELRIADRASDVVIRSRDQGDSRALAAAVNGLAAHITPAQIQRSGSNSGRVGEDRVIDALLLSGLTVRLGAGNDELALCGLKMAGRMRLAAGIGSDTIAIDDSEFHAPLTIDSGTEPQTILIDTRGEPAGPPTVLHAQSSIRNKASRNHIQLGVPGERGNSVKFRARSDGDDGRNKDRPEKQSNAG